MMTYLIGELTDVNSLFSFMSLFHTGFITIALFKKTKFKVYHVLNYVKKYFEKDFSPLGTQRISLFVPCHKLIFMKGKSLGYT